MVRKCIRCGTEMKEECAIKVEGAGYGIVLSSMSTNYLAAEWELLRLLYVLNVVKFPFTLRM